MRQDDNQCATPTTRSTLTRDRPALLADPLDCPTRWLIICGGAGGVLLLVIVVVAMAWSGIFSGGKPTAKVRFWTSFPRMPRVVRRSNVGENIGPVDFLADELFPNGVFSAEHLGINDEDIDHFVTATWNSGAVGRRPGAISSSMTSGMSWEGTPGLKRDSYRGYEVWEFPQRGRGWRCSDGYIVAAASIELRGKCPQEPSTMVPVRWRGADDDHDMKRMLGELDDGFQIQAQLGNRCQVERCRGYVFALTEADENAERFTVRFALLFGNERSAERAADDYDEVADFLELAQGIDIEDTEADGDFVVGRAVEEAGDDNSGSSNGKPAL